MDNVIRRIATSAFVLLFAFASTSAVAAWQWANPLPQGNILDDVVWGGTPGMFVAVGHNGAIITSPTGTAGTWTVQTSGTTSWLQDVEWNNDLQQFIAVGSATEDSHWMGAIVTSPDGVTWTLQPSNAPAGLGDVTWTGTQYVAVGANSTIVTSPNGTNWTLHAVPAEAAQSWLSGIAWNGATFVAVGAPGTILFSPDGFNWTALVPDAAGPLMPTDALQGVAWNGATFVAVGQQGVVLTSPNGVAWTRQNSGTVEMLRKIRWIGGRFVVSGSNGFFMAGNDGVRWTQETTNTTHLLEGFAQAPDGTQMIVGKFGTLLRNVGAGWQNQTLGTIAALRAVALNGTTYVAVGDGGVILSGQSNQSATPPVRRTTPVSQRLNDVIWDGTRYTAVGDQGVVITSTNGVNWSAIPSGSGLSLNGIASNGTVRTIVGNSGTILSGPINGSLVPQSSGVVTHLNDVVWSGTQFVAVGDGGAILTSTDGSTWTRRTSGITHKLNAVAFGNGVYVAGGALFDDNGQGFMLRSGDGINWTQAITGSIETVNEITWDGARFMAVTTSGLFATGVMVSGDGTTWNPLAVTGNDLFAVQANGTSAVAVGDGGAILIFDYEATVVADSVTTPPDTPVEIAVLANDLGTGLHVTGVGSAAKGGAMNLNGNGTITYSPPAGFLGTDSFAYTIADAKGGVSSGTVTVNVSNTVAAGGGTNGGGGGGAVDALLLVAAMLALRRKGRTATPSV